MFYRLIVFGLVSFTVLLTSSKADDNEPEVVWPVFGPLQHEQAIPHPVGLPQNNAVAKFFPAVNGSNIINVSTMVRAKISVREDKPTQLIMMLERFRTEKGDKTITKFREEKRTRKTLQNGKEIELKFTVMVPHSVVIEDVEIKKSMGIKPQTFPASKFQFYTLAGESIDIDQASKHLSKLTPVFFYDQFRGEVAGLPKMAQQALREDCLIVTTGDKIRQTPNAPVHQFMPPVPAKMLPARIAIPAVEINEKE